MIVFSDLPLELSVVIDNFLQELLKPKVMPRYYLEIRLIKPKKGGKDNREIYKLLTEKGWDSVNEQTSTLYFGQFDSDEIPLQQVPQIINDFKALKQQTNSDFGIKYIITIPLGIGDDFFD